jgi:hypothetical protein
MVGLITWITSLVVLTQSTRMHRGLQTRVRVASTAVLVGTPLVTVGVLFLAAPVIWRLVYSGVPGVHF